MLLPAHSSLLFIGDSITDWDRIHPNATGHTILARAFLSAIGA